MRLSHLNKDYLLTYLLTFTAVFVVVKVCGVRSLGSVPAVLYRMVSCLCRVLVDKVFHVYHGEIH